MNKKIIFTNTKTAPCLRCFCEKYKLTLLLVFAFCFFSFAFGEGLEDSFAPKGYTLAWNDEFDGGNLDLDKWFYRNGLSRNIIILTEDNVSVKDGSLNLKCEVGEFTHKDGKEYKYRGSGVISDWRFSDGYYEARSFIISADHWHPAFWLERANSDDDNNLHSFNNRSEIDIMECEPQRSTYQSIRLHDFVTGGEHRRLPLVRDSEGKAFPLEKRNTASSDQRGKWFVWSLKLNRHQAKFYENGRLVRTVDIPEDFVRDSRNIILSCLTLKDAEAGGVQKFDWVRYYQSDRLRESLLKECELQIQQSSVLAKNFHDVKDASASAGYWQVSKNVKTGDYIRYKLYVPDPGKYRIRLRGNCIDEKPSKWQLLIDGEKQSSFAFEGK